jgi:hypothetical protein
MTERVVTSFAGGASSRVVWVALAAVALSLAGCGASTLPAGRGLYWSYTDAQLQAEGYPDAQHDYSRVDWSVLHDAEGVAYGPRSYVEGKLVLDHSGLERTDTYLQSRWVRLYRSDCCDEWLLAHFLEILDLCWYDATQILGYTPDRRIEVYSPKDLDDYREVTGHDFWVTHTVRGSSIVVEPITVLFQRTLAGHAARAAMVEAFLDMQCHGALPPWFREGLSSYVAEEGPEHLSFVGEFRPHRDVLVSPAEMKRDVFPLVDREKGRIARYNAFLMVWHLSEQYGFDGIRTLLRTVAEGEDFAAAVHTVYGMDEPALEAMLDPRRLGEPTTTMIPRHR